MHFLARCSNFCKPLKKKKIRSLSVQPGLRGSNDLRVGRRMAIFQLFFTVQGTGGSPTGPDRENKVGDQDIGSPDRPISSGSCRKKSKSCSDEWHRWRFCSAFRHFGAQFAESFRMSKSSWMMDPTRSREMPSCSAIDLAEIRRSSKISSWIWSIISGMVTVLGRLGRGASQVEKSLRLNWATQFLAVAYDGACSPNVSFRMARISFGALLCIKKNLMTALWNRARRLTCFLSAPVTRKDLQLGTWTDPSFQRYYRFRPTTSENRSGQELISTPSYLNLAADVRTSSSSVILRSVRNLRTALFWVITQRLMVITYRRFGTTFGTGSPETMVRNYHYSLRNYPEERRFHLFRGGSLKSRRIRKLFERITLVGL